MRIINSREKYLEDIRVKAFGKMGKYQILVTARNWDSEVPKRWISTVRVFDQIAGHYTLCHGLSEGQEKRLIKIALEN